MHGQKTGMVTTVEEEPPAPLTDYDRHNLTITDKEFKPHTWEDLKEIISSNRLEKLVRRPSDTRRYVEWTGNTKKEYGSILSFVAKERLRWTPTNTPGTALTFDFESAIPFESVNDYKTIPNDWPYGVDQGISHIIVWLKNRLDVQPPPGDLTPNARAQVNAFVDQEFVKPVAELTGEGDNVIWFKNWVALQSVPGIDHVHVLLRDVPKSIIDAKWIKREPQLSRV